MVTFVIIGRFYLKHCYEEIFFTFSFSLYSWNVSFLMFIAEDGKRNNEDKQGHVKRRGDRIIGETNIPSF